tara:strand:+ start:1416 stop:2294 length:879 start_codon:yes stop_codon:yes gene_type:complete
MANIRKTFIFIGEKHEYIRKRILSTWTLINALAIDTICVAISWQFLVAKAFGTELEFHHPLLLGAAVWLGYVADRIVDSFQISNRICTTRHLIAFRYRILLLVVWGAVFASSIFYALLKLSADQLCWCFPLAFLCVLNLIINAVDRLGKFPIPKEFRVGLLFSAGIFIFIQLNSTGDRFQMLVGFLCFCFLCFANCCYIANWEQDIDIAQGQSSFVLRQGFSLFSLRITTGLIAFVAIVASILVDEDCNFFFLAIGLAGILLPLIDSIKFCYKHKRLFADFSLIVPPLIFLL